MGMNTYMLTLHDDEGSYPVAPFTTLEKAQAYAKAQRDDDLKDNELGIDPDIWALSWTYSEDAFWLRDGATLRRGQDRLVWSSDETEWGWYTIRITPLDPEPGTKV